MTGTADPAQPGRPVVALLTDFGTQDHYAGVMKGVILSIAPQAALVDISHQIPPQDLHGAAYALLASFAYFPAGTVFCCVVDPGVGSARRAVAARVSGPQGPSCIVCPDNGLLSPLSAQVDIERVVTLDDPRYQLPVPSTTFHGRDIFAPAAAHVAAGTAVEALGTPLDPAVLIRLDWPEPAPLPQGWRAAVIHVDHFGNLVTNLSGDVLEPPREGWCVAVGTRKMRGLSRSFADVAPGQPVAYVGSSGFLEVAIRQGDARRALNVGRGAEVLVTRRS